MKKLLMLLAMILIIALGAVLAGCSATLPPSTVVYEKKTFEKITGYEDLLQPCTIVAPPNKKTYVALNKDEKEDAMFKAYLAAVASTNNCNLDKAAVLKIIQRTNQEIDAFNKLQQEKADAVKEKK